MKEKKRKERTFKKGDKIVIISGSNRSKGIDPRDVATIVTMSSREDRLLRGQPPGSCIASVYRGDQSQFNIMVSGGTFVSLKEYQKDNPILSLSLLQYAVGDIVLSTAQIIHYDTFGPPQLIKILSLELSDSEVHIFVKTLPGDVVKLDDYRGLIKFDRKYFIKDE